MFINDLSTGPIFRLLEAEGRAGESSSAGDEPGSSADSSPGSTPTGEGGESAPSQQSDPGASASQHTGEGSGEGQTQQQDQQGQEQGQEQQQSKETRKPWFQRRIDQLTRERKQEQERREAYEAYLRSMGFDPEQLANGQPHAQPQPQQPQQPRMPNGQYAQNQQYQQQQPQANGNGQRLYTEEEIEQIAAQRAQEQQFNEASNQAYMQGKQEFGDEFDAALNVFHSQLGGLPRDVVEAALETGAAHKVIHSLGKDPDRAMEILSLPAGPKRAVALAKYANDVTAPRRQSSAPAPVQPQVGGSGSAQKSLADMPINEFMKQRNEKSPVRKR